MKTKYSSYVIAVLLTILSAFFIVLTSTLRILLPSDVTTFESILYMNGITLIVFAIVQGIRKERYTIKQKKLVFIRSIFGLVGVYFFFRSYQLGLSLSAGTMIVQMQPIWSAIGMLVLMKEVLRKDQRIILPLTLLISLFGVGLISNIFSTSGESLRAVSVSLVASMISGIAMVIIRKIMLTEHVLSVGIFNAAISFVVPLFIVIIMGDLKVLEVSTYLILLFMGITNALVVGGIALAAHFASPTKTGPYSYAAVAFAPIVQIVVFGTTISGNVLMGSIIIVSMSVLNFIYTNKFNQKEKEQHEQQTTSTT
ncbi:MAG TPA: DMT family transporter [Bacilli bacterium]|nr:DMT family transporter [Bacilli bacterium]